MQLNEIKNPVNQTVEKTVADLTIDYSYDDLMVTNKNLTSLKGSPKKIIGNFKCDDNNLKTLEGGPDFVGRSFDCTRSNLVSLKGAPRHVGTSFYCTQNKITSLEGCSRHIGASLVCGWNPITNFHDVHKYIDHVGQVFNFNNTVIESHVLGLLMIEGIEEFKTYDKTLLRILTAALEQFPNEPKKRVLYAQKRLLDEHKNGQELAKL